MSERFDDKECWIDASKLVQTSKHFIDSDFSFEWRHVWRRTSAISLQTNTFDVVRLVFLDKMEIWVWRTFVFYIERERRLFHRGLFQSMLFLC